MLLCLSVVLLLLLPCLSASLERLFMYVNICGSETYMCGSGLSNTALNPSSNWGNSFANEL